MRAGLWPSVSVVVKMGVAGARPGDCLALGPGHALGRPGNIRGRVVIRGLVSAGHTSRTLCSTVSMTSSIFPLSTCLAMLRVKPLAVATGTCEGSASA